MALEIMVDNKPMIINIDVIDRDIALLKKKGLIAKHVGGVYQSPRPDIHNMLLCLRDKRNYDPNQIESVCLDICPFNTEKNPVADDGAHLDDCWIYMFNAVSLDGKTEYVEYKS